MKSFRSFFQTPYNQIEDDINKPQYNQINEFQSYCDGTLIAKYINDPEIIVPYKSLATYYENLYTENKSYETFLFECGKYSVLNNFTNEDLIAAIVPNPFCTTTEARLDLDKDITKLIEDIYLYDLISESMNKVEELSWDDKYQNNILKFEDVPNKFISNRMAEQVQLMRYKWIKFRLEELKVASIQSINYLKRHIPQLEQKIKFKSTRRITAINGIDSL